MTEIQDLKGKVVLHPSTGDEPVILGTVPEWEHLRQLCKIIAAVTPSSETYSLSYITATLRHLWFYPQERDQLFAQAKAIVENISDRVERLLEEAGIAEDVERLLDETGNTEEPDSDQL